MAMTRKKSRVLIEENKGLMEKCTCNVQQGCLCYLSTSNITIPHATCTTVKTVVLLATKGNYIPS